MKTTCELKLLQQRDKILINLIEGNELEIKKHCIAIDKFTEERYDLEAKIEELKEKCKCQED